MNDSEPPSSLTTARGGGTARDGASAGARECLRLLERLWPRSTAPSDTARAGPFSELSFDDSLPEGSDHRTMASVEALVQHLLDSRLISAAESQAIRGGLSTNQSLWWVARCLAQQAESHRGDEHLGGADRQRPVSLGRFLVMEELGRGGMGTVYRALDTLRQREVALKLLHRKDAAAASRLKQEFRALADLHHRNLVLLDELFYIDGHWFFTMELVDGRHFLDYVGQGPGASSRLTGALVQLAEGLHALHAGGKLHRDVKPSNVLVTGDERVVLLDFGMAVDAALEPDGKRAGCLAGTIDYMAPEQARCEPALPASDWYAVGVMVFEALTGRRPHMGSWVEVLTGKLDVDAPAPEDLLAGVPEDLNRLCCDLLRREPADRPSGADVRTQLRRRADDRLELREPTADIPLSSSQFVGRTAELADLADAFAESLSGDTVVMHVRGPSGIGKTALVEQFLEGLPRKHGALVLRGRCYERESVPYKALDSVVDALIAYLRSRSSHEVQAMRPEGVAALIQVFPGLSRLKGMSGPGQAPRKLPDDRALRSQAFVALRDLLVRLGKARPLVVYIDDLQWGDVDSAVLLWELLSPPGPPMLLVISYRSEEVNNSACLRELLAERDTPAAPARQHHVDVRPLGTEDCLSLAQNLLRETPGRSYTPLAEACDQVQAVVEESGGNPYFVHELSRHLRGQHTASTSTEGAAVSLERVMLERIDRLPPTARRLLEVVALSSRRLAQADACKAAGATAGGAELFAELRAAHLLRTCGPQAADPVETYHDRIRELVISRLAPDRLRHYHGQLAHTLEASGADPETLFEHFRGAGSVDRARHFAELAAETATRALAFDRAARLYRWVLVLWPEAANPPPALRVRLGDALVNAGRWAEAATEFSAAASGLDEAEATQLRWRAGEQWLRSGHFEQGAAVFDELLRNHGLRMHRTAREAVLSLMVHRALLRLRRFRFTLRDPAEVSAVVRGRLDACWAVSIGLGFMDSLGCIAWGGRHAVLALWAGDAPHVVRALLSEAGFVYVEGRHRAHPKAARLLKAARPVLAGSQDPLLHALANMFAAHRRFHAGNWRSCLRFGAKAESILERHSLGVSLNLVLTRAVTIPALFQLGEIRELRRLVSAYLAEADDRGDILVATNLRTFSNVIWLAADDPDRARAEADRAMREWSPRGTHLPHIYELFAQVQIDLYRGEPEAALARLTGQYGRFKRVGMVRVGFARISLHSMQATSALGAIARGARGGQLHKLASEGVRALEKEKLRWCKPLTATLKAGIAFTGGCPQDALRLLQQADEGYATARMALHSMAARRVLGKLRGGERGDALVAEADAWMAGQDIVNPARMTRMLIPWGADDA